MRQCWRHDTQHNDIQHNNTQHEAEHCYPECRLCSVSFMLSVIWLNVVILNVVALSLRQSKTKFQKCFKFYETKKNAPHNCHMATSFHYSPPHFTTWYHSVPLSSINVTTFYQVLLLSEGSWLTISFYHSLLDNTASYYMYHILPLSQALSH